jgi:myo-inositol 2-dehydrogenase / D-chiro-inositol 1-dehydrogenase
MRIAFIGTGGIARSHAAGLVKRSDVTFTGLYDIIPEKAQSFGAQYGGTVYAGLAEMLDSAKPDAVWICIPPYAHGEAERAVLARRIPFLVEKPVSNSLDTARRVLEQVERTGTLTATGYMNRYRRSANRAKEILANDPAVLVHGGWVGGTPGVAWWRVKAQSGGQIVEQTTHIFDLVRYIVGEPKLVYAQSTQGYVRDMPNYDVEDASTVAIQFAHGAVGNLVSCCASRAGGGVHLTIAATKHYMTFTGWEHALVVRKSTIEEEHIAGEPNIFEIEDGAFIEAVKTGDASLVRSPYADALKTLAFCLAAGKSLETGAPVEVASL